MSNFWLRNQEQEQLKTKLVKMELECDQIRKRLNELVHENNREKMQQEQERENLRCALKVVKQEYLPCNKLFCCQCKRKADTINNTETNKHCPICK